MEIHWFGQSCFRIKGKQATVVIDPFDPYMLGIKLPKDLSADLVLSTHNHHDHNNFQAVSGDPLKILGPGEYEKNGVIVTGISSYHDNSKGSERGKNTIYTLLIDGINIVHLGDLGHLLSDEQTSLIDATDILMIPVGANYTINGEMAVKVVAQLEPKIIIPMHYKLPDLKVDLEGLEGFLKEMGIENPAPLPKLLITAEKLPEETTVVVLNPG